MTKHEFIKQYNILNNGINKLIKQKEKCESRALKVTPTWSDMPKGSDGENPRELAICEMMDCEAGINQLIDQLNELRQQVRQYIQETGDNDNNLLEVLFVEK